MSDEILSDDSSVVLTEATTEITDVTPRHILSFAKWILAVLAIIFLIAAVIECIYPGSAVFDACKVTLPSLATLVIGYYFGTTKS